MQLLRDGRIYDTVTLDAENNWRHTWRDLDDRYEWTVVEQEVEHYTAAIDRNGTTFVVTNTHKEEPEEEPENPEEPEEPVVLGDEDEKPSDGEEWEFVFNEESPHPEKPEILSDNTKEKLPQTGVLWWPVPVLGCGGLMLLLFGWIWKRRHEDEE